jgi:pimeloyl-ACP methyl ester carboxylesterase
MPNTLSDTTLRTFARGTARTRSLPRALGAVLMVYLVATGCSTGSSGADADAAPAAPAPAGADDPGTEQGDRDEATGDTEGTFDVGGHSLYLRCTGSGSPTVLYLHGAIFDTGFSPHHNGRFTEQRLQDEHRVCVYDRRNVGRSDTVDAEQRPEDVIADLRNLLAAAEVEPPYVLLGASFGGVVGYLYANTYPDEVVGMVQLDSMFPDELEYEHLLPEEDRYEAFSEEDACCTLERIDHFAMLTAAAEFIGEEPAIPMTYFYSLLEPHVEGVPEYDDAIVEARRVYVDRFSPGTFVEIEAPHFMEPAIPDEIADALRDVIAASGA